VLWKSFEKKLEKALTKSADFKEILQKKFAWNIRGRWNFRTRNFINFREKTPALSDFLPGIRVPGESLLTTTMGLYFFLKGVKRRTRG
jgi:hypothetical protein